MAEYLLRWPKSRKVRFLAALSYLGFLCLIPLTLQYNDDYLHYHSRQGLVLWIWGLVAIFALYIPIAGAFFFSFSVVLIALYSLAGILSVVLQKVWRLPFISTLAETL